MVWILAAIHRQLGFHPHSLFVPFVEQCQVHDLLINCEDGYLTRALFSWSTFEELT
jgi:hypothetical protein